MHVAEPGDARRPLMESFLVARYAAAYGADIEHFLPVLMGLADERDQLLGVIGVTPGRCDSGLNWFCEQYLEMPAEQVLAERLGRPVSRAQLAEVGNLAGEPSGAGRLLLGAAAAWLDGAGCDWAIFTATRPLRGMFRRLRLDLVDLGEADPKNLKTTADGWGSYYQAKPRVVAAAIADVRAACAAMALPVAAHAWLDGLAWVRRGQAA